MFDLYKLSNMRINKKRFEQQIWEKYILNERKQAPIGWVRTVGVMAFKELVTL